MTLRTPRRRISPRTKRRYRTIKNFLRRALGNSSQPDIKINSSIAVNVTNLNRKLICLEDQLKEVSRHLLSADSIPRNGSGTSQIEDEDQAAVQKEEYSLDTKLLYKTPERQYRKYDDSDDIMKLGFSSNENIKSGKMNHHKYEFNNAKCTKNKDGLRVIQDRNPYLLNHKSKSVYDNVNSTYSTSSYHSLVNPKNYQYMEQSNKADFLCSRKHKRSHCFEKIMEEDVENGRKYKELHKNGKIEKQGRYHDHQYGRKQKNRHTSRQLDSDYIADIIKKQYRPIKLFGKRESDISQFSAPICRDQEYTLNENIIQGSQLCSCCYGRSRPGVHNHNYINDQRSICDTKLYSSKKRLKNNRKHVNNYNDSELYDLIPVKETSSPKPKRKFEENGILSYHYCKEVPPSPRTLRPKLNLNVQNHTEIDGDAAYNKLRNTKHSHSSTKKLDNNRRYVRNADSLEILERNHKKKTKSTFEQDDTTVSSEAPIFNHKQTSATHDNNSLNKCSHIETIDKTDKALCEIKDILQTFLLEIKKESSNSGTSNVSNKCERKCLSDYQHDRSNTGADTKNIQNGKNNDYMEPCSMPLPYMSPYPNPCCYPIFPVCPINCMQNGYVVPSPSYACATCANKEEYVPRNTNTATCNTNNETEQLIKEIYNFVKQTPKTNTKEDYHDKAVKVAKQRPKQKTLTSRSIGGSSVVSRHDAKVGTPKLKCYSKSCEAIGSPNSDVSYNRMNASYSDTILEKLSLEVTGTESESEISSVTTIEKKDKTNKFKRVLRSFGFLKKKPNENVIEELSESESTNEIDIKHNPPFKQEIKNYMMHGQEYFHPPPVPLKSQNIPRHGLKYSHYPGPSYFGCSEGMQPPYNNIYMSHEGHYSTHPTAPPYPSYVNKHHHIQPQVPLCLKEIEVKSMATQSEKKMSFFQKFTKKLQPESLNNRALPKNSFTQTHQEKLGFWKTLQMKQQMQLEQQQQQRLQKQYKNLDPVNFSLKTQKELAQGDMKMRNAMLKKLFHKRNPFSPGNLIVRTILGKDKSSFGEPPTMFRPRMFF